MVAAAWRAARAEILSHIGACGCLPVPASADELRTLLDAGGARCPSLTVDRPPGKAVVIVCTLGLEQQALARSLRSLTQMRCEDFEIVVVDNRPSSPETRALVEGFASTVPVRYVAEPRPGLAVARNTGVASAGDAVYVAFTDDDVIADAGCLSALLGPFAEPEVQAVTGLVMPLSLASAAEKRFEQYAGFGKGVRREIYDLDQHAANDRFLYPYWGGMFGSGNSMAFRSAALLAVGGFDPALGAGTPTGGGEDIAAFSDVILAGGKLVYEPRSLCWHQHRADEQALRAQVRNYGIGLTAVLWRYLTTDRRFSARLVRSLPAIAGLAISRKADRAGDRLPADLARLEQRGRLLGPWRYAVSRRQVLLGDHGGVGAAGEKPRERRPEADQAGAQTRT
jgi:glycosyltransferase involved in cell wall biosynthesis